MDEKEEGCDPLQGGSDNDDNVNSDDKSNHAQPQEAEPDVQPEERKEPPSRMEEDGKAPDDKAETKEGKASPLPEGDLPTTTTTTATTTTTTTTTATPAPPGDGREPRQLACLLTKTVVSEVHVHEALRDYCGMAPLKIKSAAWQKNNKKKRARGQRAGRSQKVRGDYDIIYFGQHLEGDVPNGFGRCFFLETMDSYIGQWKNGWFDGIGVYRYNNHNRSTYAGQFKNGKPDGFGCFMNLGPNERAVANDQKKAESLVDQLPESCPRRITFESNRVIAGRFDAGSHVVGQDSQTQFADHSIGLKAQVEAFKLEKHIVRALSKDDDRAHDNAVSSENGAKQDSAFRWGFERADYFYPQIIDRQMSSSNRTDPHITRQFMELFSRCSMICYWASLNAQARATLQKDCAEKYEEMFNTGYELMESLAPGFNRPNAETGDIPVFLCLRQVYFSRELPSGEVVELDRDVSERFFYAFTSPSSRDFVDESELRELSQMLSVDYILKLLSADVEVVLTGHSYGALMAKIVAMRVFNALYKEAMAGRKGDPKWTEAHAIATVLAKMNNLYCVLFACPAIAVRSVVGDKRGVDDWAQTHMHLIYSEEDRIPFIARAVATNETMQLKLYDHLRECGAAGCQLEGEIDYEGEDKAKLKRRINLKLQGTNLDALAKAAKAALSRASVWYTEEESELLTPATATAVVAAWQKNIGIKTSVLKKVFSSSKTVDVGEDVNKCIPFHVISSYVLATTYTLNIMTKHSSFGVMESLQKLGNLASHQALGISPLLSTMQSAKGDTTVTSGKGGPVNASQQPGGPSSKRLSHHQQQQLQQQQKKKKNFSTSSASLAAYPPLRPGLDVEITKKVVQMKDRTLHVCLFGWHLSHIRRLEVVKYSGTGVEGEGTEQDDVVCWRDFRDESFNANEGDEDIESGMNDGIVESRKSSNLPTVTSQASSHRPSRNGPASCSKGTCNNNVDDLAGGDVLLLDVYRDVSQMDIDMILNYGQASELVGIQAFGTSLTRNLSNTVFSLRITTVFSQFKIDVRADELTSDSEKLKLADLYYLMPSEELARVLVLRIILLQQASLRQVMQATGAGKEALESNHAKKKKHKKKHKKKKGKSLKDNGLESENDDDENREHEVSEGKDPTCGRLREDSDLSNVDDSREWDEFWKNVNNVIDGNIHLMNEVRSYNSFLGLLFRFQHWKDTAKFRDDETELTGEKVGTHHETDHVFRRRWELQERAREYFKIIASTFRVTVKEGAEGVVLDGVERHTEEEIKKGAMKLRLLFLSEDHCRMLKELTEIAFPDHYSKIALPDSKAKVDDIVPPFHSLFDDEVSSKRAILKNNQVNFQDAKLRADHRMLETNQPHMLNLLFDMELHVDLFANFFDGQVLLHQLRQNKNSSKFKAIAALAHWPTNALYSMTRIITQLVDGDVPKENAGIHHSMVMSLPSKSIGYTKKLKARLYFRKRRARFAAINSIGDQSLGPLTTKLALLGKFMKKDAFIDTSSAAARALRELEEPKPQDVAEILQHGTMISEFGTLEQADADRAEAAEEKDDEQFLSYPQLQCCLDSNQDLVPCLRNIVSGTCVPPPSQTQDRVADDSEPSASITASRDDEKDGEKRVHLRKGMRDFWTHFREELKRAGIECSIGEKDNSFSFNTVCQWIRGVTGIRRPLSVSLTTMPFIVIVGPQNAGKSTILNLLGFDAQVYHSKGSTKVFDAFALGKTGAFVVDCFGRNEALKRDVMEAQADDSVGIRTTSREEDGHYRFRRSVDMYLPTLLSLAQYIVVALPATDGFRPWNDGFDQIAKLLHNSHAPICILNTKFDLALDEGLAKFEDEREKCYDVCKASLGERYENFERELPRRDIMARLFYRKQRSTAHTVAAAAKHPTLKKLLWTQKDLKIHLRDICITHFNLDRDKVDEAFNLDSSKRHRGVRLPPMLSVDNTVSGKKSGARAKVAKEQSRAASSTA